MIVTDVNSEIRLGIPYFSCGSLRNPTGDLSGIPPGTLSGTFFFRKCNCDYLKNLNHNFSRNFIHHSFGNFFWEFLPECLGRFLLRLFQINFAEFLQKMLLKISTDFIHHWFKIFFQDSFHISGCFFPPEIFPGTISLKNASGIPPTIAYGNLQEFLQKFLLGFFRNSFLITSGIPHKIAPGIASGILSGTPSVK